MTAIYDRLSDAQKREIRMYGVTEAEMREVVEQSITFRHSGPAMMAASIMSDCQEMLSSDNGGSYDFTHCTFANYWNSPSQTSLVLTNENISPFRRAAS